MSKKSLTYVEIDVPYCTRTYSTSPCQAQIGGDYEPDVAVFNGTDTYLKRGGGLTGAADSKQLTVALKIRPTSFPVGGAVILSAVTALNGNTQRTSVLMTSTGAIIVQGYNAAGTLILDQRDGGSLYAGQRHQVIASFDLTDTAKRHIYIDDVSRLSVNNAFTNDDIDFTMPDWGIGAYAGGSGKFPGGLADLWYAPGVYLDLSVEANRRKFINADLTPVDLGADGSTPTGSAPLIYLSGDVASWHSNKGSGGGFTEVGALTEGTFSTGLLKCFNTIRTCQDRANFDEETVTHRFGQDVAYRPLDIECIPTLIDARYSPGTIKPGESIGERSTLSLTFKDDPHPDTGPGHDKYYAERDYNPVEQGTLWGKLRARQPYLRERAVRLKQGYVGLPFDQFETRNFLLESASGATLSGVASVEAKDVFKSLSGGRRMAPEISNGFLLANIDSNDMSFTLSPSGIGDAEYETSGLLAIGGKEIVSFTRSGDVVTIVARAQKNTTAQDHKAEDRVQTVLSFVGEDPANILQTLMVDYGGVPAGYINIDEWLVETEGFLGTVYTADIAEPTPVEDLCNEIIEQAALCVWPDDIAAKIRLIVLRAISTDATLFDEYKRLKDVPLGVREQPDKRISQVWTYYAQINPLRKLDDLDNYRSVQATVNLQAETDNGSSAIRVITSRWIPQFGRSVAQKLNNKLLGRYQTGPRAISFATQRYSDADVELGRGYNIGSHIFQDASGARENVPVQITRIMPAADRFAVESEEMRFETQADDTDPGGHLIPIDANSFNLNLRTIHDSLYGEPQAGDVIICTIFAGVIVGSHSTSLPAFDVGTWPAGIEPSIINLGRIQGTGGVGGDGINQNPGRAGGPALYARSPVNLDNTNGEIFGGGGGGGPFVSFSLDNAGGGGGAGTDPGSGGIGYANGHAGTSESAGTGGTATTGTGASGGGPGLAGSTGTGFFGAGINGGAAGAAIDGDSYVTLSGTGDIRGSQIN